MAHHQSLVNFRNLINDLKDMYSIDITEIIITELIANALDAKASRIYIDYDFNKRELVITDNGNGMTHTQFIKYHDLAAGIKTRGAGIGFAGVGAKISFNIADAVITETVNKEFSGGSLWRLSTGDDHTEQLIWEDIPVCHLTRYGTRVQVCFNKVKEIEYSSINEIISILQKHYLPLFDVDFLDLYKSLGFYSDVKFFVNNELIMPIRIREHYALDNIKDVLLESNNKLFGYGFFGLGKTEYPFGGDRTGVLISVYGKIVKNEWFSIFPNQNASRVVGIVEVPDLIRFLNTSKQDFIRPKGRNLEFEKLYQPIREKFSEWINEIGLKTTPIDENLETRKIEKELMKIIETIPEFSDFFGSNNTKRLCQPNTKGDINADQKEGVDVTFPTGDKSKGKSDGVFDQGDAPGTTYVDNEKGDYKVTPISRKAKKGPKIIFINSPDLLELSFVEGNTISINSGHKVFIKVKGDFKEKRALYLIAIGCAIMRFRAQQEETPDLLLIDRILSAWGETK